MSDNWRKDIVNYGIVRARSIVHLPEDVTPPDGRVKKKEAKKIAAYRSKEQAMVCLTCPKKKCGGSDDCFRRRRKMLKKQEERREALAEGGA